MKYMLLIYGDEDLNSPPPELPDTQALLEEYFALSRRLRAAGIDLPAEELARADTATTVRIRDGEVLVSDGPFIEAKEQLGGYYMVEAENFDEAAKWAAQIPGARTGAIEIRPIVDHGSPE